MPSKRNETGPKERKSYYGGDKLDENDEESLKLYLNDCRQRQAALYSPFLFKSASARFLLSPPDASELLVASGQSRFHLNLQNMLRKLEISRTIHEHQHLDTSSDSSGLREVDLIVCKTKLFAQPFPRTPDLEAEMARVHGFPLLVWPLATSKEEIMKFLDRHYRDCGHWYRELDKVMMWLNEKWRPLTNFVGISTGESDLDSSTSSPDVRIQGIPSDSVAALFMKKKRTQYEKYGRLLTSYFQHRLEFSPGFHYNPIHRELAEMSKDRQSSVSEDSGFFNVVGNRLLRVAQDAKSADTIVTLNAHRFVSSIADPVMRDQCLQALLPGKILKNKMSKISKSKKKRTDGSLEPDATERGASNASLDMDETNSDSSSVVSLGDDALNPTGTGTNYPNRPITKEIMDNRGIVKYRHKRERNPRVHLRHKYHKATVRYRSRVAPVKREENPYAGEAKGIRVHLVKSHKFK